MSPSPIDPGRPDELSFVWRCYLCQKCVAFGINELNRFLHHGWPVCCGQVALIFRSDLDPRREAPGAELGG